MNTGYGMSLMFLTSMDYILIGLKNGFKPRRIRYFYPVTYERSVLYKYMSNYIY